MGLGKGVSASTAPGNAVARPLPQQWLLPAPELVSLPLLLRDLAGKQRKFGALFERNLGISACCCAFLALARVCV